MSALVLSLKDHFSQDEAKAWSMALRDRPFGEIVIDWCTALQETTDERKLEIRYIEVLSEQGEKLALGVLHILRNLDLSEFMGPGVQRVFSWISKTGFKPLQMDIAFLELPLLNASGLLLTQEGMPRAHEIALKVAELIRSGFKYDIFNIKSVDGLPEEGAFRALQQSLQMMKTEFLSNMVLPLNYPSFDEYYQRRSPNARFRIRKDRKTFAAAGGVVREDEDFASNSSQINRLFQMTCKRHVEQGDLPYPIQVGESFISALNRIPEKRRRVFLAECGGELVGFALTVRSGNTLIFSKCGLDYSRAEPIRAYFNLYYAMIDYAIREGIEWIELGAEAYDTKKKMGASPAATRYYFELNNRWISPLIKLLVKRFES
jgi:hypothetical protein